MLGHASQTSGLMQNVHDKCLNLPDPDIFTVDTAELRTVCFRGAVAEEFAEGGVRDSRADVL